ncbi:MAG: hypothetical protein QW097_00935, partial [archaeon]
MIKKGNFQKSPYVGLFCVMNDNFAIVPKNSSNSFLKLLEEFDVEIIKTNIAESSLVGVFCCLNNEKIIVPNIAEKEELKKLKDNFREVVILDTSFTAIGNLMVMNDRGGICSPLIEKEIDGVLKMKIMDTDLCGSLIFANNSGFAVSRDCTDEEFKKIEKILKVPGVKTTINGGDKFVKSGICGNSKG